MALAPVPKTASLVMGFTLWGQQVCMTRHVTKADPAPWTEAELTVIIESVRNTWANEVFSLLGGQLKWRAMTATDISVEGGAQVINSEDAGVSGGASGATAPGNVTWAFTLRTGHVGRAFRGRNYVPGLPEPALNGNEVLSAFANAVVAGEVLWAASLTSSGYTWTVVSRSLNNAPRPTPVALPVTSVGIADLSLDSQRKRLNKRGS